MIILRKATMEDAANLLAWRNDPKTRRWSRSSDIVTPAEHHAWLERTLAYPFRSLYVAERDVVPIGTGRLDYEHDQIEVSVTVAPEHRGHGYGEEIVRLLLDSANQHPLPRWVSAYVKPFNLASLITFQRAGFVPVNPNEVVALQWWRP